MLHSIIVIAGPNLEREDSAHVLLHYVSIRDIMVHQLIHLEAGHGAEKVRQIVKQTVRTIQAEQTETPKRLVIISRYGFALEAIGDMIEAGHINHELVGVHLRHDLGWEVHTMSEKGVMNAPWPYGILQ